MKNAMKTITIVGMIFFTLGMMAGCKGKSKEEQIEELAEKLGEAKTEKEAAEIAEKIEKLEERAKKKSTKEIIVKLGEPFTFWQKNAFGEQTTRFSITFEKASTTKEHPFAPDVIRTPKGKKHVEIIANIKNLGPRETAPETDIELKVDKGYIYNVGAFGELYRSPRYEPSSLERMYRLEPRQTGWMLFHSEIPEDTTPIEIFGTLGGSGLLTGNTKFRLRLAQEKKEIPLSKKIPKEYTHEIHPKNAFDWNPNLRGYCTWYVADRWLWDGNPKLPSVRNARFWIEDAQKQGMYINTTEPVQSSIVVFGPTERNNAGHIAYVESVSEEYFTISQMNAGSTFTPGTLKTEYFEKVTMDSLSIRQTHYKGMNMLGFIYPTEVSAHAEILDQVLKYKAEEKVTLDDIIEAARTWSPAFTSWFGKPAPDFTLTDITGQQHKLNDYRGKDIMVIFWASWANPCQMEIPHLIQIRNTLGEDKLAMLAISNEDLSVIKEFVSRQKINYTVFSNQSDMPTPFNLVNSIPCSFFINPEGKIKLAATGMLSLAEIKAILNAEFDDQKISQVKDRRTE